MTTVADSLPMFRGRVPNNLAPQAPHLAIKVAAMGWDGGHPTDDQLAAMKRALAEWLDAGAVGMAAGLEYQPGALSPVSELVELCKLVAATGGVYAPHQRGYWVRLERGCGESFDIGRQSGVKVHISHLAIDDTAARLLDEAQASGVDVSFDMYPYTAANTHLLMMLPEWAQAGGYRASMEHVAQPDGRLRAETAARVAERGVITLSCVEGGESLEGRSLGELGRPPASSTSSSTGSRSWTGDGRRERCRGRSWEGGRDRVLGRGHRLPHHVDEVSALGWVDPPEKLVGLLDEAGIAKAVIMTYTEL